MADDDEINERITRLEEELADLRAVQRAGDALQDDAASGLPNGLLRLRSVKRNDEYPSTGGKER